MNDYLISILLGVIEGVTEFLPISSTAHLRIAEALLSLNLQDDFWKMYSIVIQLGAILALPVYFRQRILDFISTFPRGANGRSQRLHPSARSDHDRVRRDRDPGVPLEEDDRREPRKSERHGLGLDHRRRGHVGGGRALPAATDRAAGGDESAARDLDRRGADFIGRFSGDLALHVHHRRRSGGRAFALGGAGVFLLPLHAHDGGGDRLRFAENDHAAQTRSRGDGARAAWR